MLFQYKKMIPKVIYMCHKHLDKIQIYSQNWKKLNPDWEIQLFDDDLCRTFLIKEYSPLYLDIFDFIPDGPIKADFWRICIIQKYGGLYVDADIEPLIPLKDYIEDDDDFVTCISVNFKKDRIDWQFNPHFILSHKNNIVLENCINRYIEYYTNKVEYSYWTWSICVLFQMEGVTEKKSQVIILYNGKYKFLYEKSYDECEYNGVVVLNNRYKNYSCINHQFIE